MDAITLRKGMALNDTDYPARVERMLFLTRVRDGKQYDHIEHPFAEERNGSGEYIPISHRRPSARTNLCRVVVNDAVSLLFGEGRFPIVSAKDSGLRDTLKSLVAETRLVDVMNAAATHGSVGSVVILMRILEGRVFFSILDTTYLTPVWKPNEPDKLEKVVERYKVKAADLRAAGYIVGDGEYWFCREWDSSAERWFLPQPVTEAADGHAPIEDAKRTVGHSLGMVPMVWIKNLPSTDKVDGECTFSDGAICTVMEIDYHLSQVGRGLKYASDPTLLIKEPAMQDGGVMERSASNAIVVSEKGDAKMLEINGTAAAAVIDYIRTLREVALESMRGNRTNVDKLNGAQSGRALEMMNQGLIWLADQMRVSYGQNGLLELIRLVCIASKKVPLTVAGQQCGELDEKEISLVWPRYFAPTYDEKFQEAQAWATLVSDGLASRRTAIANLAADNNVEDVGAELAEIESDQKAFDARAARQAAQVQIKEAA